MDGLQYGPISFINASAKKAFKKTFGCIEGDAELAAIIVTNLTYLSWGLESKLSTDELNHHVGKGAIELKKNGSPAKRCVYVLEGEGKIVVLHAFDKTTNGVDKPNMKTARDRYKLLQQQKAQKAA